MKADLGASPIKKTARRMFNLTAKPFLSSHLYVYKKFYVLSNCLLFSKKSAKKQHATLQTSGLTG